MRDVGTASEQRRIASVAERSPGTLCRAGRWPRQDLPRLRELRAIPPKAATETVVSTGTLAGVSPMLQKMRTLAVPSSVV